jgi:hypothetical protein
MTICGSCARLVTLLFTVHAHAHADILFSGLRKNHVQERLFPRFTRNRDLEGRMGELPMCPGRNCRLDSRFERCPVFVIHRATKLYIIFMILQQRL